MAEDTPEKDASASEEEVVEQTADPEETAEEGVGGDVDSDREPEPEPERSSSEEALEQARDNEVSFSWHASEYVHNHKGMSWYAGLAGVVVVLIALAVLLQNWLGIVVILAMGAAVYVYAHRPPRTLLYELTPNGVSADGKRFPFAEFRSFGVLSDAEWHTIDLEPTKRFSPRMAILFDDADFDSIVGHLELHLPRADRDPDVIERATRWLRF